MIGKLYFTSFNEILQQLGAKTNQKLACSNLQLYQ